jgi:hypothetical protein
LFWSKRCRVAKQRHGSEVQKECAVVPFLAILDCFVTTLVQEGNGGSRAESKINSPGPTNISVDGSMPNAVGQDIGKLKFNLQGLEAVSIFDGGIEVTSENEFVILVERSA